jgi:HAD superfamily hydrolase (TIGR01549 family)
LAEINWRYDKAEADNMQLTPGAFELLVFLARNQRKIGIVTNGDSYRQWQKLFITGIADFFRPVIISEEVRLRKPCPEIYQLALNQLGVEAQNCAFVGDSPSEDIAGANSVGLVSIRIRQGKYCSVEPLNELEEPIYEFNSLFELESALSSAFECPPDMRAQTTPSRKLPKVQNEISFNLRRSNSIPHEVGDED